MKHIAIGIVEADNGQPYFAPALIERAFEAVGLVHPKDRTAVAIGLLLRAYTDAAHQPQENWSDDVRALLRGDDR